MEIETSGTQNIEREFPTEIISKKLEDLQLEIAQHQKEHKENQEAIQVFLKELTELNSHQDKIKLEEGEERDLENQKIDLLQQLKMSVPIRSVKKGKDEDLYQNEEPPLLPGHRVLSVCSYNGWYEEGTIIHDCGNLTYFVKRSSGEVARIQREEILSDADDYRKEIKEDDHVIGPHPEHLGSYCPGVVLSCTPDLKVMIQYYDTTEAFAPREHVYLISQEKYERDVAYILMCEERWVGQPVVARNDDTGSFHLAEVLKRADDGKQYAISWADGETAIQDIEWIYGKFSKPHVLSIGGHVLTLAYPPSLMFLPGVITAFNGTNLQILFCNGKRCQNVEPHHCFGLSENKYNRAVQLYHQKNQTRESDNDHSASEIEDSLSEMSSFTVSSIGSTKKTI